MLDTPEAVVEALRENHERPHGLARTVTAEELVEAAEVFEKPDVLVTALLELMTAYEFTGEQRKSPVAFARILKLWDTAPDSFSPYEAHQVFWRFKWVTTSLLQVPEMPLATVAGWIDQMRERYEAAGHGVQPVAAMRYHLAQHTGTGVPDAYDLWATRPRTDLSDCEACETRHHAWYQVTAGDDARALDIWRPVLDGEQVCSEEPQMSQARALLPLLRTGRTDEARSHHLTGYRKVRGNTGMQAEVGLHLEFCALSRNEGRGLEILAENRPLFEATGAPLDRLGFLTGVEVLLARLVEDGHDATAVAGPPGRDWTAAELLAHVRADAEPLAAAFDARNGTSAVGDRRRERLARRPLLDEPLPLGLRAAAAVRATAQATPATAPPTAARTTIPDDFAALVREARRMSRDGHPGDSRLWTRIAERRATATEPHDATLGPEDLLRAELAEHEAQKHWLDDRHTKGVAELAAAVAHFERLDMPWHALSARARTLAWSTSPSPRDDEPAPDRAATRTALDELLRAVDKQLAETPFDGEPRGEAEASFGTDLRAERTLAYLSVRYSAAFAAYQELLAALAKAVSGDAAGDGDGGEDQDVDALTERFEEAVHTLRTEATRLGYPHQSANARQFVADMMGRRGAMADAERELRAALQDLEAAGRPWRRPRPTALLAQILLAQDRPQEAVELLHSAIADAVTYDDTSFALAPTYMLLGHASSHLGDHNGAVRHLSEAAARFDQAGDPGEATDARLQLAMVLGRSGRNADAVAVLESVLADEAASGADERALAQARLTLGRGLRELEEYLPAAEELLRLADTVADWPEEDRAVLTLVAAEAATTLALADRWDAADTAYARAVAAHAEAPNPPIVCLMLREFARLTMQRHDTAETEGAGGTQPVDAALAHLARADAVLDALPPGEEGFAVWYERGEIHYRRARVLAEAGRFEEALPEAEAAVATHEGGGEEGELARAEAVRVAALIEGNGLERTNEAIARLTTAAARCRNSGHPEAAQVLDALRQEFLSR
ncbi:tetratricopeptide repeat protein [Streptomyces sp. NPDC093105]|uniref:tetratricopeptide repeat protein n=1 Tax=Streptomyces sp. NPDC093105 TaxID=3366029 RepID=UPI003802C06E